MAITKVTRHNLFIAIRSSNFFLWGHLHPVDFLSRLYDLKDLHSREEKFDNAYDEISIIDIDFEISAIDEVIRDRLEIGIPLGSFNESESYDELYYWILDDPRFKLQYGDDSTLLRFLCETIHPEVRSNEREIKELLQIYNEHLKYDGFQIFEESSISGRPVFAYRNVSVLRIPNLPVAKQLLGMDEHIAAEIARMERDVNGNDPASAIGTAKNLVEACCKTILKERNAGESNKEDIPGLVKSICKVLSLTPDDIPNTAKAADTIKRLLSNLATVVQGLAELRNNYGAGHGKAAGTKGLQPRHARLAVGAASTLAVFLFQTHKARPTPTQETQKD